MPRIKRRAQKNDLPTEKVIAERQSSYIFNIPKNKLELATEFASRLDSDAMQSYDTDGECYLFAVGTKPSEIKKILSDLQIDKVDGILLDLGVSSYQLDEASRGFSYNKDDKLDMRMDRSQKISAFDVVNFYHEKDLANLIYEDGEERFSRQIAKNITLARREKPIETTGELVKIIEKSKPQAKDGHPAKRTFQAIRIEVNNEIKPLEKTVEDCIDVLAPKGRLCIITFHSLEDRAVKNAYNKAKGICTCPKDLPYCVCGAKELGIIINKKPIIASYEEQEENTRSKSAKLRIFEKI